MKTENLIKWHRMLYGSILGICVVSVTQLVTRDLLDAPLTLSMYCFAAAIPCLVFILVYQELKLLSDYKYKDNTAFLRTFAWIGMLGGYAGIASLFWHNSTTIGLLFIVFSSVAFVMLGRYMILVQNDWERRDQPKDKETKNSKQA